MPLIRVKLPDDLPGPPPEVMQFIDEAQRKIDAFIESHLAEPINSFVPSDFPVVYGALRHVAESGLATGDLFCEWGSGAGVVACMAAMVGFRAFGIEFEAELVELSKGLAGAAGLDVEFHCGNFVPTEGQRIAEQVSDFEWLAVGGVDAYDGMGMEIEDFDVIFAYPWPGEQRVVERLFERFGCDGSLLLTYNGVEGVRMHRKRSGRAKANRRRR